MRLNGIRDDLHEPPTSIQRIHSLVYGIELLFSTIYLKKEMNLVYMRHWLVAMCGMHLILVMYISSLYHFSSLIYMYVCSNRDFACNK